MNERIKELKHQAFLWYDKNIPEHYSYENRCGDAWEDKFAELIVRECAKWMSDGNIPDGFYEAGRMLEHFGVEE